MMYIFIGIFLVSVFALLIGLVSPTVIIRWKQAPNRLHVLGLFIPLIIASYVMVVIYPSSDIQDIKTIANDATKEKTPPSIQKHENLIKQKPVEQVPLVEAIPFIDDKVEEEKFFEQNYQNVVSNLRQLLRANKIILDRATFIDYKTHLVLKLKTNTIHEVTIKVSKQSKFQTLSINLNEESDFESLKQIISSTIYVVSVPQLSSEECMYKTEELFRDIEMKKFTTNEFGNIKILLSHENYYKLMPK